MIILRGKSPTPPIPGPPPVRQRGPSRPGSGRAGPPPRTLTERDTHLLRVRGVVHGNYASYSNGRLGRRRRGLGGGSARGHVAATRKVGADEALQGGLQGRCGAGAPGAPAVCSVPCACAFVSQHAAVRRRGRMRCRRGSAWASSSRLPLAFAPVSPRPCLPSSPSTARATHARARARAATASCLLTPPLRRAHVSAGRLVGYCCASRALKGDGSHAQTLSSL